tara:strand:+ start:371 stop:646 length:276 start_codon:yes stop_codon:yes gene_type:complete
MIDIYQKDVIIILYENNNNINFSNILDHSDRSNHTMDDMKQLELFEPYELDQNKSYQQFMWTKNGAQTIYWPTQQQWNEMCEQQSHNPQQD